tara:strand:+ start:1900 stop:2247 length:348 start_codon:yes stop_codon:yes gene_type:complete
MKKVTITSGALNNVLIEDTESKNIHEIKDVDDTMLSHIIPVLIMSNYNDEVIHSFCEDATVVRNDRVLDFAITFDPEPSDNELTLIEHTDSVVASKDALESTDWDAIEKEIFQGM